MAKLILHTLIFALACIITEAFKFQIPVNTVDKCIKEDFAVDEVVSGTVSVDPTMVGSMELTFKVKFNLGCILSALDHSNHTHTQNLNLPLEIAAIKVDSNE